jgi:hypothetical protein
VLQESDVEGDVESDVEGDVEGDDNIEERKRAGVGTKETA